jgi:thiopurine S-methyltransferase
LQPEFWHDRWQSGQIGFHQPAVDRNLSQHWRELELTSEGRVFVPLCGKSLDLLWLRDQGHSVAGVELSAVALESFCLEQGIPARRRMLEKFDVYEAPGLELYRGDFFALTQDQLGSVAAVYDRAALISWTPELRGSYVERMTALTKPGTQTLLITLEYPQAEMAGPPFCVSAVDVERGYGRTHAIRELSRHEVLSSEPRLRSRGLTQLHEVCYRLIRL